jgi:hypothetical protein
VASQHSKKKTSIFSKKNNLSHLRVLLDRGTDTHHLMGEGDVDLTKHELPPGGESEAPVSFEMLLKGKPAGKVIVFLIFFNIFFCNFCACGHGTPAIFAHAYTSIP